MFCKAYFLIREVEVPKGTTLKFSLDQPNPITFQVSNPPMEFLEKRTKFDIKVAFCEVIVTVDPNVRLMSELEKINSELADLGYKFTNFELSEHLRKYLINIKNSIQEETKKLVGLLRWTTNCLGPYYPLEIYSPAVWSLNIENWIIFPGKYEVVQLKSGEILHIDSKGEGLVQNLLNEDKIEPLSHELFREAWSLRGSNPRSALMIGYVAAEVGVKELIAKQIPNTRWLMDNIPYPPLFKILSGYLEELPGIKKIYSITFIPKSIRKNIQTMSEKRNSQAHAGINTPDSVTLLKMLQDVRELLLLLDYYSGYDFALSFVRKETLDQIERESKKKSKV